MNAMSTARPARVVIVGAGHVGATLAYSLVVDGLAPEIVLIDQDHRRAEGEAMDLNHAVPFSTPCRIWAGTYDDCAGAAVVVLTAGAGQKPGESRLDLAGRNAAIFADLVPQDHSGQPRSDPAGGHQPGRRAHLRHVEAIRPAARNA